MWWVGTEHHCLYGMELGGQCSQRSFEAGEERLLHQVNPFPFSIPDLPFFNILTKLVKKNTNKWLLQPFYYFTWGGDRIFFATFSNDRSDLLCKVVKCSANTADRVVVVVCCAWTAGKEKTGAKLQRLAYVYQLTRC